MPNKASGHLYIIAAPSGAGKTSLTTALVESLEAVQISVSHTTRPPRPGEEEGVQYHFVSPEQFAQMVQAEVFLEYACVYGCYYGTSREWVLEKMQEGIDVVLEIDWQGARQICQQFPKAISIFILPPSIQVLSDRLLRRRQDSEAVIAERMQKAREEIAHYAEFDYLIVNEDFGIALGDLKRIIRTQRLRSSVQRVKLASLLAELTQNQ